MPLAPYAMNASRSRGRRFSEPAHPYRTDYARDRDRIIHSRAFRRLEAKTQVFTTRYSDHFRNRLTHTLEVTQIARTVAGALDLNTELAEALALVHDIGHAPFGHAGERKLDELLRPFGSCFNHNLHALRIVEQFEQRYLDFSGLNLTFEVREGIVKHSRDYSAKDFPELAEYALDERPPLEAQLIDWVDEIAYNAADLDDGFEARLLDLDTLLNEVEIFRRPFAEVAASHPSGRTKLKFNEALKRVLDTLATDLIDHTRERIASSGVVRIADVRQAADRLAGFTPEIKRQNALLKLFLHRRLYENPQIVEERDRSVHALEELFLYYLEEPSAMPQYYSELTRDQPRHVVICDYIAGMTDHFLLRQHRELLGDKATPAQSA